MEALEKRVDNVEEKVDKLERMMMRVLYVQQQTQIEIQSLKEEMREFKNEMRQTITEMKDDTEKFKVEVREIVNEMKESTEKFKQNVDKIIAEMKEETKELKNEMKEFKTEMREEARRMNKQWGELANKLGTIVEDIILPATRPVLEKYFKCDISRILANAKAKEDGYRDEFDVIAVSNICKSVYLIEVKSTVRNNHIINFPKKIESFKRLFPEYEGYNVIPILATLKFEEDKLNLATKHKIYAMAYREWEYMDLLNFNEIK